MVCYFLINLWTKEEFVVFFTQSGELDFNFPSQKKEKILTSSLLLFIFIFFCWLVGKL